MNNETEVLFWDSPKKLKLKDDGDCTAQNSSCEISQTHMVYIFSWGINNLH